jgi:hypothetical protein
MLEVISKYVDYEEIIVRFLYSDHFKKKIEIKKGDIFLPYKGGVSVQREKYCSDAFCKKKAQEIQKKYKGITIFKKKSFDEACVCYKKNRQEFEANIKGTPINVNGNYCEEDIEVTVSSEGNPSHADIVYINPAQSSKEETPKPSLRVFSKILLRHSDIIIDDFPEETEFPNKIKDSLKNNI